MSSAVKSIPDPVPLRACTITRDVQDFDTLIDEMDATFGEGWGDLSFADALTFLTQPDAAELEVVALAVNPGDEGDTALLAQIIQAAKARGIKVILVAGPIGPHALHQLLRQRADDFVPYPLPDGAFGEAIARLRAAPAPVAVLPMAPAAALQAAPALHSQIDRDGKVLSVQGLAGGAGASTFAANLAWELAIEGKDKTRVCLMDFDFQFGAVATYLDLPRREAVFELLTDSANADGDALLAAMLPYRDRLHVLTAPPEMLPLDIVGPDDVARILDKARQNFDFIVIDLPKTVVAWTETVLTRAHLCFALLELDLRSAQNVLRLLRALKAENLPHEKLRYILNRAPKFTDITARSRIKRMAESLGIALDLHFPDGGPQVTQSNDHGHPLAEDAAKNPLRKEIQKLAKSLLDLNKVAATAKP